MTQSDALVLFGVTADLADKMIFPELYAMEKRGVLDRRAGGRMAGTCASRGGRARSV